MGERVNCQINHTTTGKSFYTNEFPPALLLSPSGHTGANSAKQKSATAHGIIHIVHIILNVHIFPEEEILEVLHTAPNTHTGCKPAPYCGRGSLWSGSS